MVDLIKNFSPRLSRENDIFGSPFLVLEVLKIAMLCGWTKFVLFGFGGQFAVLFSRLGLTGWLQSHTFWSVVYLVACSLSPF